MGWKELKKNKHLSTKTKFTRFCKRCGEIFTSTGKFCRICEECKMTKGGSKMGRPAGSKSEWGFPKGEQT